MTNKTPGAQRKGQRPAKTKPDAAVAQPAEHRASNPKTTGSTPAGRSKPDWDAIEASHRTGRYSDGQLAELFGVSREAICRKRKKDQAKDPKRWQKDLREQTRQATAALLAADAVAKESGQRHNEITVKVTDVISAAAEQAKDVILRHRTDIGATRELALALLDEVRLATTSPEQITELFEKITEDISGPALAAAQQQFRDFMRVHSRVGSVHKLADTLTKLQTLERKAFNLDDPGEKPPKEGPAPGSVTQESAVDAYRAMVHG